MELSFIVVEARIETRLSKLETRASSIRLQASIRASLPRTIWLSIRNELRNRSHDLWTRTIFILPVI